MSLLLSKSGGKKGQIADLVVRQECRRAEHKWLLIIAGKLQVFYEILKNCLSEYQEAVKLARSNYFSGIISRNCHNSRILFFLL